MNLDKPKLSQVMVSIRNENDYHEKSKQLTTWGTKIHKLIQKTRNSALPAKQLRELNNNIQYIRDLTRLIYDDPRSFMIDKHTADLLQLPSSFKRLLGHELQQRYQQTSQPSIMCRCPRSTTGCVGYVDSTTYECLICSAPTCQRCHEEVGAGHTCHADAVASVAEIKRSSRACPTCSTNIQKSVGCDQMWCPSCHTAFDYATGNIETGRIHNPEYFEYMRRTKGTLLREAGDRRGIPYDMFDPRELVDIYRIDITSNAIYHMFCDVPYVIEGNRRDVIEAYQSMVRDAHIDDYILNDVRKKYIKKEMTADKYQTNLYKTYVNTEIVREAMTIMDDFNHRLALLYYGTEVGNKIFQLNIGLHRTPPTITKQECDAKAIQIIVNAVEEYRNSARIAAINANRQLYALLETSTDRFLYLPFITGKMFKIASLCHIKETIKLTKESYKILLDKCAASPRLFDLMDVSHIINISKNPQNIHETIADILDKGASFPPKPLPMAEQVRIIRERVAARIAGHEVAAGAGAGAGAPPQHELEEDLEEVEDIEGLGHLEADVVGDMRAVINRVTMNLLGRDRR
jgi:hypothetical protein